MLLVSDQPLSIDDQHPEEYNNDKKYLCATRTAYRTKDHSQMYCWQDCEHSHGSGICTFYKRRWRKAKTSYAPKQWTETHKSKIPSLALLSVNHQVRAESAPIFYGENQFHIYSMSALIPFLKDRTTPSLKYLRDLHFHFSTDRCNLAQISRQREWAYAINRLSLFPDLAIRRLGVCISDGAMRYVQGLQLDSKTMYWVHELVKNITNLDTLGVNLEYTDLIRTQIDYAHAKESTSEEDLWTFLAPKMLKEVGGKPHNLKSLEKRRTICGSVWGVFIYVWDSDEE